MKLIKGMYLPLVNPQEEDRKRLVAVMGPQRVLFTESYIESKDIAKACLAADYSLDEGNAILANPPRWFRGALRALQGEEIGDLGQFKLRQILELPMTKINEDGEEELDKDVLKVQADLSKYATANLLHDIYSTKTEEKRTVTTTNISVRIKELDNINANRSRNVIEIERQEVANESSLQDND